MGQEGFSFSPFEGGAASQAVLEVIGLGLLMLDAQSALLYANAQGQRELNRREVLLLEMGSVQSARAVDAREFSKALGAARQGVRTMLAIGDERRMIAVVPLAPSVDQQDISRVLVVWGGESPQLNLTMQLFAKAVGLTHSEREVLQQLCAGHGAVGIALLREVKVSTVRTHISHLRAKMGARNIPQMVATVSQLPPLAQALRNGGGAEGRS
jgi:DNA-binding CsgD family transcriptional regulator